MAELNYLTFIKPISNYKVIPHNQIKQEKELKQNVNVCYKYTVIIYVE